MELVGDVRIPASGLLNWCVSAVVLLVLQSSSLISVVPELPFSSPPVGTPLEFILQARRVCGMLQVLPRFACWYGWSKR